MKHIYLRGDGMWTYEVSGDWVNDRFGQWVYKISGKYIYDKSNSVKYTFDGKYVYEYCNPEKEGEFTAPQSLKNIGYKAFSKAG